MSEVIIMTVTHDWSDNERDYWGEPERAHIDKKHGNSVCIIIIIFCTSFCKRVNFLIQRLIYC